MHYTENQMWKKHQKCISTKINKEDFFCFSDNHKYYAISNGILVHINFPNNLFLLYFDVVIDLRDLPIENHENTCYY